MRHRFAAATAAAITAAVPPLVLISAAGGTAGSEDYATSTAAPSEREERELHLGSTSRQGAAAQDAGAILEGLLETSETRCCRADQSVRT